MIVTKQILNNGKSINGGWSKKQLALFGIEWPLLKSWKSAVIGKNFPKPIIQKFLELKNIHLVNKAEKRKANSVKLMKKYGQKYKCAECFHRKTKSCTDNLPNGCEYWYNPKAKQPFGVAYER